MSFLNSSANFLRFDQLIDHTNFPPDEFSFVFLPAREVESTNIAMLVYKSYDE